MNTQGKIKVVFLGEQSTGKTSILTRFIDDKFQAGLGATVGIDFMAKTVIVEQKALRLQFWDTAGQQRFRSLIPNYLKEAVIAFIVFDVSNQKSFINLPQWIDLCNQNMREKSIMVLLGNKCDLEERQVSEQQIKKKASDYNLPYFEVSAKTGYKIKQTLNFACEELLKYGKKKPSQSSTVEERNQVSVRLNMAMSNETTNSNKKNNRCC